MELGVFGDTHLSRSLPHTTTNEEGKDIRYTFQKKLLKKAIKPFKFTMHAGDLTDKTNTIDGKILEDTYNIFKDRNSLHIVGNHDRSKDNNKYTSMVEFLGRVIPGFKVVDDLYQFDYGKYKFICCSYYCKDDKIKRAVKSAVKDNPDKNIAVFGHFHFYDKVRGAGRKLYKFARKSAEKGVLWLMGHEHNPSTIKAGDNLIGHYIGCVNPKQFREKQGKIFAIKDKNKPPTFIDYPTGEKFIIEEYSEGDSLPEITEPELTYLKIKVDDLDNVDYIKEQYENLNLRYFSVPYQAPEKEIGDEEFEENVEAKTVDDYVVKACEVNEFEVDEVMPYHERIKQIAD